MKTISWQKKNGRYHIGWENIVKTKPTKEDAINYLYAAYMQGIMDNEKEGNELDLPPNNGTKHSFMIGKFKFTVSIPRK